MKITKQQLKQLIKEELGSSGEADLPVVTPRTSRYDAGELERMERGGQRALSSHDTSRQRMMLLHEISLKLDKLDQLPEKIAEALASILGPQGPR